MTTMCFRRLRAWLRDDRGATLVEYGLLIALIAAVCIVVVTSVGAKISAAIASFDTDMP